MDKDFLKFISDYATRRDLLTLVFWNIFQHRRWNKFEESYKDGYHFWACMKFSKQIK